MQTKKMTRTAMLAAVYTALSLALAPLSFGNIQFRLAETMTMLALLDKTSIWGITLGCFLTNLIGALTGVNPTGLPDAIIGTSATLLAGWCTWLLKERKFKGVPVLSILMPVIFNFVFVGAELAYILFPEELFTGFLICGCEVALGEAAACIIGYLLARFMAARNIFTSDETA